MSKTKEGALWVGSVASLVGGVSFGFCADRYPEHYTLFLTLVFASLFLGICFVSLLESPQTDGRVRFFVIKLVGMSVLGIMLGVIDAAAELAIKFLGGEVVWACTACTLFVLGVSFAQECAGGVLEFMTESFQKSAERRLARKTQQRQSRTGTI